MLLTSMLVVTALTHAGQVAADESPALTREQAFSLSARELGRIVLGQVGDRVEEVSRPVLQGIPFPDERLRFLYFGLTPRPVGPGLCEATIIHVSFSSSAPASTEGRAVPVRADTIGTSQGFKVAGDLERTGPWDQAAWERQAELCRQARPIVPAEIGNLSLPAYFGVSGRLDAATIARIIQRALAEAAAGTLADLRCLETRGASERCGDPRTALRGVLLDHLAGASSEEIAPLRYRITAHLRDPANVGR